MAERRPKLISLRGQVIVSAVLLAALAGVVTFGVRGELMQRREHRGEVTVAYCTFLSEGAHGKSYSCIGSFTADRGDLQVPSVTFVHSDTRPLPADARVAATVAGPDDGTATEVSESTARLILSGGGALFLLLLLFCLWYYPAQARRKKTGSLGPKPMPRRSGQ